MVEATKENCLSENRLQLLKKEIEVNFVFYGKITHKQIKDNSQSLSKYMSHLAAFLQVFFFPEERY